MFLQDFKLINNFLKIFQGTLIAFKRINIPSQKQKIVTLSIPVEDLQKWNLKKHQWEIIKGEYHVLIGSHSRDEKLIYSFKIK